MKMKIYYDVTPDYIFKLIRIMCHKRLAKGIYIELCKADREVEKYLKIKDYEAEEFVNSVYTFINRKNFDDIILEVYDIERKIGEFYARF